jgi:hypothetical protein
LQKNPSSLYQFCRQIPTVDPNDLSQLRNNLRKKVLKEIYTGRGFFLGTEKPIQKPPNENIRGLWERGSIYTEVSM